MKQTKETSISKDSLENYSWSNSNNSDFVDIDNKNGRVASIDLFAFRELGLTEEDGINEAKKICEAVNNYNALKEINKELIEALEAIVDRAEMRFPHFEKEAGLETVNKAKSALQKAKQL